MSWCLEGAPDHEGFLIGWRREPDSFEGLAEIRCADYESAEPTSTQIEVHALQVACDCGWRSSRLTAPFNTTWAPCLVHLPEFERCDADRERILARPSFETRCRQLWRQHCAEISFSRIDLELTRWARTEGVDTDGDRMVAELRLFVAERIRKVY